MRPIPAKLRRELSENSFMERCVWTGDRDVTWEHCWTYAGKQINERWAIVPLKAKLNTSHPPKEVKDYCRWISLMMATPSELAKYPKKNWEQEKRYLDNLFLYGRERSTTSNS